MKLSPLLQNFPGKRIKITPPNYNRMMIYTSPRSSYEYTPSLHKLRDNKNKNHIQKEKEKKGVNKCISMKNSKPTKILKWTWDTSLFFELWRIMVIGEGRV